MTKEKTGNPYCLGKDYPYDSLLDLFAFVMSFFFSSFIYSKDLDLLILNFPHDYVM